MGSDVVDRVGYGRVGAWRSGRGGQNRTEQTGHGRVGQDRTRAGQDRADRSIDRLVGRSIDKQIDI